MEQMAKSAWIKLHPDYKLIRDNRYFILKWVENVGTSLVEVQITPNPKNLKKS